MQRNRGEQQNGEDERSQENWSDQENISCKDGQNKGQKWQRPNRSRKIRKMWQEYIKLCKESLNDPDNHDGVITHLEPDILEWEVQWALGSITTKKANCADGIPAELFQLLKDDAVKVLHSLSANLDNSAVATRLQKVSFHSNLKERPHQRCTNYCTIMLMLNAHFLFCIS